jgi:hypothetical protein
LACRLIIKYYVVGFPHAQIAPWRCNILDTFQCPNHYLILKKKKKKKKKEEKEKGDAGG